MSEEQLQAIDTVLEQNDLRRAEVLIAKQLRSDNLSGDLRAQILLRRVRARLLSERPDDALEELQTVLAIQPDYRKRVQVKTLLGDIYFSRFMLAEFGFADRSNTDLALEYYDDIIAHHSHYELLGWVYYQRARVYLTKGNIEVAYIDLISALDHQNNPAVLHAYCYERLGFIELFEKRNSETALTYFAQAIEHYPEGHSAAWLVQVHISQSRAFRELEQNDNALKAALAAFNSLDPTVADFREILTEAHLAVGEALAIIPKREAEAIDHLLQFLQNSKRPLGMDVTWSRVYETIGNLSLKLERYDQAIEAYQSSLTFNPYHPWEINIHYQIARCYYRMRAYEKVITAIEQMQQTATEENHTITDYRVFYVLANAYFALEQYQQAVNAYQQAFDLAPPSASNLQKIQTYLKFSQELAAN